MLNSSIALQDLIEVLVLQAVNSRDPLFRILFQHHLDQIKAVIAASLKALDFKVDIAQLVQL